MVRKKMFPKIRCSTIIDFFMKLLRLEFYGCRIDSCFFKIETATCVDVLRFETKKCSVMVLQGIQFLTF